MKIVELTTPSFLVEMDILEQNIKDVAALCKANGKNICPMVKTHKSSEVAALQKTYGAASFLVGTLDEAEKLAENGFTELVLAYPVAGPENLARVIELAKKAHVVLSFDGIDAATQLQSLLRQEDGVLEYLVIIDCGLHRFGVKPEEALDLVRELSRFSSLRFKGIATHPGHVYAKSTQAGVEAVAEEEVGALETARYLLSQAGFTSEIVASGSTPTLPYAVRSKTLTTLRPGNYIFNDAIQVALGVVPQESCSLTVLATIIANPRENHFIMDAGSKCLGLDKGAHGVALVNGYGSVKNHPELIVEGLSEEVGKIRATQETCLKVGDKIEIIPNHACAAVNMSSYLIGHRKGIVERIIGVDARGGSSLAANLRGTSLRR